MNPTRAETDHPYLLTVSKKTSAVTPRLCWIAAVVIALFVTPCHANVTITAAISTNIPVDIAADASTPAYTKLSNIVITEPSSPSGKKNFAVGANVTLILSAPSGWQFNPGIGTLILNAGEITNATMAVTTSNLTVTMTVKGTALRDIVTISNIQVQALSHTNLTAGKVVRTTANPGTATIAGITAGSTSFGTLTQVPGALSGFAVTAANLSPVAGVADALTIKAVDQFGNTIKQYSGTSNLTFSALHPAPNGSQPTVSNASGASISFGSPTSVTFANGTNTTGATMVAYKAEGPLTLVVTDGTHSTITSGGSASSVTVKTATASAYRITSATATPTVGSGDQLTITQVDAFQNITSLAGNKTLTFSGLSAAPDGTQPTISNSSGTAVGLGTSEPITFTAGTSSVGGSLVAAKAEGPVNLFVTDGTLTSTNTGGTNLSLTVSAATATGYLITAANQSPTAGTSDALTIKTVDLHRNVVPFTGTKNITFTGLSSAGSGQAATITSTNGSAVSVGSITAINFVNGVNSTGGTLVAYKAEAATLAATDGTISTAGAGGSGVLLSVSTAPPSAYRILPATSTPTVGASDTLVISQVDQYQNVMSMSGNQNLTFSGLGTSPDGSSATVTSSTGAAINLGTVTAISFNNGVSALGGTLVPHKVEGPVTLAVTDGVRSSSSSGGTGALLTILSGSASILAITTQPSASATAGAPLAQQPVITIKDLYGNVCTNDTSTITTSLASGSDALQGTTNIAAINGVATFTNLSYRVAETISLSFAVSGLSSVTSSNIVVGPTNANHLLFTTQPESAVAGSPFGVQPVVVSRDVFENFSTVGLGTHKTVSIALTSGVGPLLGTTNLDIGTAAGNGTVTYTNLELDSSGTNKQLTASATGLTSAISAMFSSAVTTQTITFGALTNTTYGAAAFNLNATASSGLPVTFSIISGPATISGNTLTITGAGTVVVEANQSGNLVYASAPPVDRSFVVSKAGLTVTANSASRTYGAANPIFSGSISGLQYSDSITANFSSSASASSSAGAYTITPTLIDSSHVLGNYSVTTNTGTLTINKATLSVTANNTNRVYGAANPVFTGTVSGVQNSDNITGVYTSSAATNSSVGTYTISAALFDPGFKLGNYNVTTNSAILTVTAAALLARPNDASRFYGATNPTFSVTYSGFLNNDTTSVLTGTLVTSTTATTNSVVGTYPINASGQSAVNYSVTYTNGTLTISPRGLIVSANNATRAYGATDPAFSGTISGTQNNDNITATYSPAATAASPIGAYTITPSLVDPNGKLVNYSVTTNTGLLTITNTPLTVTPDNTNRLFGVDDPAFTGTFSGLRNNDNITATYDTTTDPTSAVGTYPITVTALSDPNNLLGNYSVTLNTGTLTINPAPLLGKPDDQTRSYGATNPVLTVTFTGYANDDDITDLTGTLTVSTTAKTNSAVGAYPITASGLSSPNYSVTYTNGTLTVTSAALAINVTNATRAYGSTNPVFTGSISGIQNNDTLTATYSSTATTNSSVGAYTITPTVTDPGNKLSNYAVTTNAGTLTVTVVPLTVSANNTNRTYGAANPTFAGSIVGLKNNDSITASYSSAAASASAVGTYTIVPTLSDPGARLGNYTVTTNVGTLTVNAATLTGTADNKARAYLQTNPVFTVTYTGFVNGENSSLVTGTLNGSTTATTNSPVGTYPITVSGQSAPNYSINYVAGTLTVTAGALTINVNSANRAYGTTNPIFAGTLLGLLTNDNITATYSSSASTNSSVGTYTITPTLSDPSNRLTNYTVTTNSGTLTITNALLTVTVSNANRSYGSSNPAFNGSLSGLKNNDNVTATFATTANASSSVGAYNISPTLSDPGSKLSNYTVSTNLGTLTVTSAALTITPNSKSRIYGAANPTLDGTIAGIQNSDSIAATFSTTATTNSIVGVYPITFTLTDPGAKLANYTVTTNAATLTINPATLNGTADNKSRVYGQTNPVFTATYTGFVNSETSAIIAGTLSGSTTANANSPVGTYPITVSGQSAANYNINYIAGTLSVTAGGVTVNVDSASRAYGASNPVFTGTVIGLQNGDNITATYSSAANTNSAVGNYSIAPTLSDPGSKLANYSVTTNLGTLTISNSPLAVTVSNAARLYGSVNPTFVGSIVGLKNNDNVTGIYSKQRQPTARLAATASPQP